MWTIIIFIVIVLVCEQALTNFSTVSNETNVTLDHKTSHKGQFFKLRLYISESWINKVCYDRTIFGLDTTIWNLESESAKNLNIEKIAFKFVQMKFLAMHITNQKLSFDIFTVGNLQNIFIEHDLYLMS